MADWYMLAIWRKRRDYHLKENPLCRMCLEQNMVTPATEVDHIVPHRGNWNSFRLGAIQSLCSRHHHGAKQREEIVGYSTQVGKDGIPLDPRHPIWRGKR